MVRPAGLEQPRVEPVVRALKQVGERRGLGERFRPQLAACGVRLVQQRPQARQHRLRFVRAGQAKADCGGEHVARGAPEQHALDVGEAQIERAHRRAPDRRQVQLEARSPRLQRGDSLREDARRRGEKGAALRPACPVRHVVGEECVRPVVEPRQRGGIFERPAHQRQRAPARLPDRVAREARHLLGSLDLPCLRRRLQAGGMGKPSGGKR